MGLARLGVPGSIDAFILMSGSANQRIRTRGSHLEGGERDEPCTSRKPEPAFPVTGERREKLMLGFNKIRRKEKEKGTFLGLGANPGLTVSDPQPPELKIRGLGGVPNRPRSTPKGTSDPSPRLDRPTRGFIFIFMPLLNLISQHPTCFWHKSHFHLPPAKAEKNTSPSPKKDTIHRNERCEDRAWSEPRRQHAASRYPKRLPIVNPA